MLVLVVVFAVVVVAAAAVVVEIARLRHLQTVDERFDVHEVRGVKHADAYTYSCMD